MLRYLAGYHCLNLSGLKLREEALAAIPNDVKNLILCGVPLTDAGISCLLKLTRLERVNLSGTAITDSGLDQISILRGLRWINVEQTQVTEAGISRLKTSLPEIEVVR